MQPVDTHYNRILWRSHRGMLELDLLLIPFVEKSWHLLTSHDKRIFEDLLEVSDPELFAWLMGHEVPQNVEFQHLVKLIQNNKQLAS